VSFLRNIISVAALSVASASFAAPIVQIGGTTVAGEGQTTSKTGVTVINFNSGFTTPAGVTITGLVPGSGLTGNLVTGNTVNYAAAPPGDSSQYLAVGPANNVTITLTSAANYIGFYAASLDGYNFITFVGSTTNTYTGTQLATLANIAGGGSQTSGAYFNIFEQGNDFTQVILSSTAQAFEIDNFAIGRAAPAGVPLPGTVALLAIAGLGLVARRKK
jgi:hypothetical protein